MGHMESIWHDLHLDTTSTKFANQFRMTYRPILIMETVYGKRWTAYERKDSRK